MQIRVMENQPPPVRVIAIGRVYRPDTVDATHSFMFHQIEGLMVDRGVTMADLKTVLRLFARSYLGQDVKIRFRPSFFPFTEPSVEVDMLWHGGDRWVEMGGAGMVDPNVFRAVGYDPEEVTGFAFGLGIERLCMRRHGIDDIRLLYQNDVAVPRPVLNRRRVRPAASRYNGASPWNASPQPSTGSVGLDARPTVIHHLSTRASVMDNRTEPSDRDDRRHGAARRRSTTATSPRSGPRARSADEAADPPGQPADPGPRHRPDRLAAADDRPGDRRRPGVRRRAGEP